MRRAAAKIGSSAWALRIASLSLATASSMALHASRESSRRRWFVIASSRRSATRMSRAACAMSACGLREIDAKESHTPRLLYN
jgi:hypothetical protein